MSHCGGGHKIFQLYVSFPNRCYKYQYDKDRPSIVLEEMLMNHAWILHNTTPWHYVTQVTQVTLLKIHFNLNFCVYI